MVIEAENHSEAIAQGGRSWSLVSTPAGFAGTGLMDVGPNNGGFASSATAPEMRYPIEFSTPGTYQVWIRGVGASSTDDSLNIGLDGVLQASADRISDFTPYNSYQWSKQTMDGTPATITIGSPGLHTLSVYMREDGMRVDRILLSTDAALVPSGSGPPESARSGGGA